MDGNKITKVKTVLEEKSEFIDIVDPSRRSGKAATLGDEIIDGKIYDPKAKTSGFGSLRPIEWLVCFESYYNDVPNLSSDWFYNKNNEGKISECQIYLKYFGTKCLTFHIFLVTGVILAKGQLHNEWALMEFDRILNMMQDSSDSTDFGPNVDFIESMKLLHGGVGGTQRNSKRLATKISQTGENITEQPKIQMISTLVDSSNTTAESADNICISQDNLQDESTSETHNSTQLKYAQDFDQLWKENSEIKNSLKTIELSMINVNRCLEKIEQSIQDKDNKFENALRSFETKVDSRISTEIDIIRKEMFDELKKMGNKYNDKLTNMKKSLNEKLTEFEEEQRQILNTKMKDLTEISNQLNAQKKEFANLIQARHDESTISSSLMDDSSEYERIPNVERESNKTANTSKNKENKVNDIVVEDIDEDVILLMDSNRRFIDPDKFNIDGKVSVKIIPCNTVRQAFDLVENIDFHSPKVIILHFGVNDLDTNSADDVALSMKRLVELYKKKYGSTKIILSEITPRMDDNSKVYECNAKLKSQFKDDSSVYIVFHSFLNNDEYFYDVKHVKKQHINKLAANLKKALRRCLGLYDHNYRKSFNGQQGKLDHSSSQVPFHTKTAPQLFTGNSVTPTVTNHRLVPNYTPSLGNNSYSNRVMYSTGGWSNNTLSSSNPTQGPIMNPSRAIDAGSDLKAVLFETINRLKQLL